jgi:hypothetical protein
MNKKTHLYLALSLFLLLPACSSSPENHEGGSVYMVPFVIEELGIQGIIPSGWIEVGGGEYNRRASTLDQTTLVQTTLPDTAMDEAVGFAAAQLGLEELPESIGTYRTPTSEWDIYHFEIPLADILQMKADLALVEIDGTTYAVLMAAQADDYETEAPYHETIFFHAVYAFRPIE